MHKEVTMGRRKILMVDPLEGRELLSLTPILGARFDLGIDDWGNNRFGVEHRLWRRHHGWAWYKRWQRSDHGQPDHGNP